MTCISYLKYGLRLWCTLCTMSYQVLVTVEGGRAAVKLSGDVPDGTYEVAGYEDAHQRSMTAVRRLPDGRYAEQASHVHHKGS